MWIADNWRDYEVLDTSSGEKLERWGKYILVRPDPQVIWKTERTVKKAEIQKAIKAGAKVPGATMKDTKYTVIR